MAPWLKLFSPLRCPGILRFEASRQAISGFGFLVRQVARMSSASLSSYIKPSTSSPVTSDILKTEVAGHMMAQHLRQPGCSWANSQLWLCKRNKAALILLIGRNVLTETRKRLIQRGLNQSHAPGNEFQEDTCWTTVLSSHRRLQRSRPAHPRRSATKQC